ncbi:MAG: L-threonylcarbamoyladenylate synthase [Planctomycetota bacterium]
MPGPRVLPATPAAIDTAVAELRAGRCVAMPTETVYGLAADGLNPAAVAAVFVLKRRPAHDPLILHVAEPDGWRGVATELAPAAQRLADRFWPGPLTLVLPRRAEVPDAVTAGLDTVGVRCPAHPATRDLLRAFGGPLAAPSANRFGSISPTRADHVAAEFPDADLLILDAGPCARGLESTVVRPTQAGGLDLLRPGAVSAEAIADAAGVAPRILATTSKPSPASPTRGQPDATSQPAPGMLDRHYAPRTPLWLVEPTELPAILEANDQRLGLIADEHTASAHRGRVAVTQSLAPSSDPQAAASHLYAAMRELDNAGLDRIVAVPWPEGGLGTAINDRLRRAATPR